MAAVGLVSPAASGAQEPKPRTWNTELVGHLAPPQDGGYADVWAHKDVAYLGNLRQVDCRPANGVWAIDLKDPAKPRALASFAKFPGSDGEDVWVGAVRTKAFKGDLAAVGLQPCSRQGAGFAGLALYDVTNPARPRELGRLATGVASGVHELGVVQRPDGRVLALAAVPYSFNLTQGAVGDLRIIDITDPRRPRELADWDVRRDGPAEARSQLAARRDVFCHSAWPFAKGNKVVAAFWSAGELFLDTPDIYSQYTLDVTTNKKWNEMTDAERMASSINIRKVSWDGVNVKKDVPKVLERGEPFVGVRRPASLGRFMFGPADPGALSD